MLPDSFEDLEFAAHFKKDEAAENFEKTLADFRIEMNSQIRLFCKLEGAFDKERQNYQQILQKLREKRIDDQNLAGMKDSIFDLQ